MPLAQLPILVYHYFGLDRAHQPGIKEWDTAYITPVDLFRSHMQYLKDNGYQPIPLKSILGDASALPAKPIVITIDDGHNSVVRFAAPVLAEFSFPAELFVIPTRVGMTGYASWDALRALAVSQIAIQSHGLTHHKLTRLKKTEVTYELTESRRLIESHIQVPPHALAVPMGRYPKGLERELPSCGYTVGCTSTYGLNRVLSPLALERIMVKAPHDTLDALSQLFDDSSSLARQMRLRNLLKRIRTSVIG